mmetsp:Transcript_9186/g.17523  ORF Transcript_9186/g.17523 Transcript_9186/m.17523 type:complete len:276 (-) Transcript_9186:669-1496(-)
MPQVSDIQKVFLDLFGVVIFFHVRIGQNLFQLLDDVCRQSRGELDVECHVQIALDKRVTVRRHTFVLDHHNKWESSSRFFIRGFGLDDLPRARLDGDFTAVQVFHLPCKTRQGLVQGNILGDQQVGPLTFEQLVFLLLNNKVNITRFHAWRFIRHSPEGNLLIVAHALFDIDFQNLAFRFGRGRRSLSVTNGAMTLHLRNHSRTQLTHFHDDTLSVTFSAFLHVSRDDLPVNGQFDSLAIVQIFQTDLDGVLDRRSLAGSSTAATTSTPAKEHGK